MGWDFPAEGDLVCPRLLGGRVILLYVSRKLGWNYMV